MKMRTAAIVLGAMLAVPMTGFAAPAAIPGQTKTTAPKNLTPAKSARAAKTTSTVATHSARGVVKSIDSNTLILERGGKKKKELTFALDPTTRREGDITVGSTVAVRYKNDASKHMALDIQPVKAKAAARKAAAH